MSTDLFARTGRNAELDSALALMERVHSILDGAMGDLEDAGDYDLAITRLERAQECVALAAELARK